MIHDLIRDLEKARFHPEPGTATHHPFRHPRTGGVIVLTGPLDAPCRPYQEAELQRALATLAKTRTPKR